MLTILTTVSCVILIVRPGLYNVVECVSGADLGEEAEVTMAFQAVGLRDLAVVESALDKLLRPVEGQLTGCIVVEVAHESDGCKEKVEVCEEGMVGREGWKTKRN